MRFLRRRHATWTIEVCGGYECTLRGSRDLRTQLRLEVQRAGLRDQVYIPDIYGGCFGLCPFGPNMNVQGPGSACYWQMTPDRLAPFVRRHLIGGEIVDDWTFSEEVADRYYAELDQERAE